MQLNFIASITVLLALYSHSAFSETIAGASYKDVCKKFEQEGVTTRTQSGGNAGDVPANVVVVVGAGSSHSRRRNTSVANSDIIVGANMTEISTQTDLADDKPATAKDAASACE